MMNRAEQNWPEGTAVVLPLTAESILREALERVYYDQAIGADDEVGADIAIGLLWDARKYLGCYPQDAGKLAFPGLYANQIFCECVFEDGDVPECPAHGHMHTRRGCAPHDNNGRSVEVE